MVFNGVVLRSRGHPAGFQFPKCEGTHIVFMNFHMDVGTADERATFATVLDPATRTEMRSTGFLLGDGLAGVSSAVFETAYMHGRRTASKLGTL